MLYKRATRCCINLCFVLSGHRDPKDHTRVKLKMWWLGRLAVSFLFCLLFSGLFLGWFSLFLCFPVCLPLSLCAYSALPLPLLEPADWAHLVTIPSSPSPAAHTCLSSTIKAIFYPDSTDHLRLIVAPVTLVKHKAKTLWDSHCFFPIGLGKVVYYIETTGILQCLAISTLPLAWY